MKKSTERQIRDSLVKEVSNDLLKDKFIQELGQKAIVQRDQVHNNRMEELRDVLRDMGKDIQGTDTVPKGMTYMGSFSVHVYHSSILNTAAFVTLTAKDYCDFGLADGALRELTGSVHETYGKARKKLRSGF